LFNYYWDNVAKVPYLLGKSNASAAGTFVSYDNKMSIGMKAQYIKNQNARGTIIWEITGDYLETSLGSGIVRSTPLLDTLNQVFCTPLVTSINTGSLEEVEIFPNPANDVLYIKSNSNSSVTCSVYDAKGNIVLTNELQYGLNEIKIQALAQGLYFAHLQSTDGVFVKKITKL